MTAEAWEPVQRVRTYEQVMAQIEDRILDGRLKAGDKLPSERDLSACWVSPGPRSGNHSGYWKPWASWTFVPAAALKEAQSWWASRDRGS